jgi:hypothetical protein
MCAIWGRMETGEGCYLNEDGRWWACCRSFQKEYCWTKMCALLQCEGWSMVRVVEQEMRCCSIYLWLLCAKRVDWLNHSDSRPVTWNFEQQVLITCSKSRSIWKHTFVAIQSIMEKSGPQESDLRRFGHSSKSEHRPYDWSDLIRFCTNGWMWALVKNEHLDWQVPWKGFWPA